uniref:Zgc:158328 n=1 Tax=Sinocyclocheilus anshuiensis TaxID=1608454 RepID=A0A671MJM2_9TELE
AIPPWLPNVCEEQEMSMLGLRQPCVQAFTRMVKVWRQGCSSQRWCMGYERSLNQNDLKALVNVTTTQFNEFVDVIFCSISYVSNIIKIIIDYMDAQCVLSFFLVCSDINECADSNGGCEGTCCNIIGSFYCRCPDGMKLGKPYISGKLISCEHRCVDLGNKQYKCECRSNYQLKRDGKHCELKDPCKEHNGGCAHICSNVNGQVQCSCRSGYRMGADFKRCEDIDECVSGQAKCAHGCVNFPGSFHCVCNPGFELGADGKQCYRNVFFPHENMLLYLCASSTDTDECENGEACCSHYCKNYPGGYECGCRPGYTPNGCTCDDIDECLSETSGCSQYCVNTLGSYECFCQVGFRLDYDQKSCLREKSCLPHSQEVMHRLQNKDELEEEEEKEVVGSEDEPEIRTHEYVDLSVSVSVCEEGSFGDDCSVSCEDCVNGGVCALEKDRCVCAPGWMGVTCNDTCAQGTYGVQCNSLCVCKNGGHCDPVTGKCLCCPQGFYGRFCRRRCNCPNNGRCHRLYGGCLCTPGLYGKFCHLPCPKWTHGAGCLEECKCTCTCKPGYHGDRCQEECDKGYYGIGCCERCNCSDGETCDPKTGECQKMCPAGYHGEKCQLGKTHNHTQNMSSGENTRRVLYSFCGGQEKERVSVFRQDRQTVMCQCEPQLCEAGFWGVGCASVCQCGSNAVTCEASSGCCVCEAGYTGEQCDKKCLEGHYGACCENGAECDHISGACTCADGWVGSHCEKRCPVGFYGQDCVQMCQCGNEAQCHHITGACRCTPGWAPTQCILACPAGTFGPNCSQSCDCHNGGSCDPVSGQCRCTPGWTGTSCQQSELKHTHTLSLIQNTHKHVLYHPKTLYTHKHICLFLSQTHSERFISCASGWFGRNCEQRCICPGGVACDHVTGRCGCPAGYTGNSCETMCPQGRFGLNCSQMCTCSGDQYSCHHVTGKCTCLPGYYGNHCHLSKTYSLITFVFFCPFISGCPTGRYGRDCAQVCLCGEGGQCHPETGRCNCAPGRTGPSCEQACSRGHYGAQCRSFCMCANGGVCDPVNGTCRCGLGWTGQHCEKGKQVHKFNILYPCSFSKEDNHNDLICNFCCKKYIYDMMKMMKWFHISECPAGFFGELCAQSCDCKPGHLCDHVTGQCLCPPGYQGDKCEKRCDAGRFGCDCAELCECDGIPCDPTTGHCLCPPGKTGKCCEKLHTHLTDLMLTLTKPASNFHTFIFSLSDCDSRFYGPGCSFPCQCAHGGQCDQRTGHCSCPLIWLGPTCEEGEGLHVCGFTNLSPEVS